MKIKAKKRVSRVGFVERKYPGCPECDFDWSKTIKMCHEHKLIEKALRERKK